MINIRYNVFVINSFTPVHLISLKEILLVVYANCANHIRTPQIVVF